jgi:hypothetical protein
MELIHTVEKNLYVVIGLIAAIALLSIMNILGVLDYFSSSRVDRIVDVTLLAVLIAVLIPLVVLLVKSRKVLERWTEMFDRNTIGTAMRIAMTRRDKVEAIRALSQSVGEISEPLEKYMMSSKSDLREFFDVSVGEGKSRTTYDILIDSSRVMNGGDDNMSKSNILRNVLEDYGAIIVKIVDGNIDRNGVESFIDSLTKYVSMSKKKQIGLSMIIGEEISPEAQELVNYFTSKRRGRLLVNLLLLIDKPSYPSTSGRQSTFIPTG